MVTARPADLDELRTWHDDWSGRLDDWYGPLGAGAVAERRRRGWAGTGDVDLTVLVDDDGVRVGHVASKLHAEESPDGSVTALVHDLYVEPGHRGRGYGRAALAAARQVAHSRAVAFGALVWSDDPGIVALVSGLTLRNQRMYKDLSDGDLAGGAATALPDGASVRELTAADYDAWLERNIAGYAADMADSGSMPPAEARERSSAQYRELLPQGLATPGYSWRALVVGGETVADVWVAHTFAPGVAFVYSVETAPRHRGRGYGRAIMTVAGEVARESGQRYLGLNVFGHNVVAIGLYASMGYRIVDQSRFDAL